MEVFLKKHKWKVIVPILIVCVLVFAFWYGGNAPGLRGWNPAVASVSEELASTTAAVLAPAHGVSPSESSPVQSSVPTPWVMPPTPVESSPVPTPSASEEPTTAPPASAATSSAQASHGGKPDSGAPGADSDHPLSASEKLDLAQKIAGGESSGGVEKGSRGYSTAQGMQLDPSTGKDKYQTDPVPEGKPVPVEPKDAVITDETHTCTLSVKCDTILDNISWLDPDKVELVPKDGVIFPATTVTFYEGESVFNVLQRELKKAGIHMEFENTPVYNSAYIEGINNLYEFDCGELSGWMYKVNDWFPNYGCSRYQLKDGDTVEWVYTCNLGIDVGGYYSVGG
jgi:hypothetical protein